MSRDVTGPVTVTSGARGIFCTRRRACGRRASPTRTSARRAPRRPWLLSPRRERRQHADRSHLPRRAGIGPSVRFRTVRAYGPTGDGAAAPTVRCRVTPWLTFIQWCLGLGVNLFVALPYPRRTRGMERLDPRQRYLFASSHVSLLDTLLPGAVVLARQLLFERNAGDERQLGTDACGHRVGALSAARSRGQGPQAPRGPRAGATRSGAP